MLTSATSTVMLSLSKESLISMALVGLQSKARMAELSAKRNPRLTASTTTLHYNLTIQSMSSPKTRPANS